MSSLTNGHSDHKPSSGTMRAAIWKGKPFHVSIDTVPKPQLLSSEDAIIRLTSSAICGSDLHIYRGILGSTNPPWTLGHEGVGIVESVGEAVQNVKPGDRVIVPGIPDHGILDIDLLAIPLEVYGNGIDFGSNDGMQGTFSLVSSCIQSETHNLQASTSERCRQIPLSSKSPPIHPENSITL
jgi:NADPH:quinone reductase-like Zn-dependent oxidoreductase